MSLHVEQLSKHFGGVVAMKDVSLEFPEGSLTAIIGPNGAGKTTFFNLITGHLQANAGQIYFNGENILGRPPVEIVRLGICRAFQVAQIFPRLTLEESLVSAVSSQRNETWVLARRFPLPAARERAGEIMELVGLTHRAHTLSGNLPHGEQKLLDIALALALEPKVLLLDEPTAGMGAEERWMMVEKVQDLWKVKKMSVIFIEHDMDIVFKIAPIIHVLKYGQVIASGPPAEIRKNQDVIDAYLGTDHHLQEELSV
jgi:branched-chain amino acid transport system ATP-binding protein